MMDIKDITVREYFGMLDTSQYDVFIDILKPTNFYCGKKCMNKLLSFDEVKVMAKIFNNPTLENIKDMFITCFNIKGSINVSEDELFFNESVFALFRAKRFLQEFIKNTLERENKVLSQDPDPKLIAINAANRLAPFSHELVKIDLAQKFGVTPDDIGGWKYSKVFRILAATSIRDSVRKDYSELK